ncbi:MAG: PEP-CTERM sorting domain-containing protein [Deltaproteobacteria bacterium]|nr:PEP-CTERM sorting domain-containing protein [Deltaproteobacteria bacterium]
MERFDLVSRGVEQMRMKHWLSSAAVVGLVASSAAGAATITGLYYVAGSELRAVPFDGTEFTSSEAVVLESLDPSWSGLSYDAAGGVLYYVAAGELRRVDFDGTQFTSLGTTLETLSPGWTGFSYEVATDTIHYVADGWLRRVGFDGADFTGLATNLQLLSPSWTGFSYDVAAGIVYYATGADLWRVGFDGTSFTSLATHLETLDPSWSGLSLIFEGDPQPFPIPEPGTIALLGIGVASLILVRGRRAP